MFNFFKKEEQKEQEERKGVEMVSKTYTISDSKLIFEIGYITNEIFVNQSHKVTYISIPFDELTEFARQFNEVIEKIQNDIKKGE